MKQILIVLALLISVITLQAQNDDFQNVDRKNEVKLNALYLVLGAFEGTYEHLLNEESGIGVSLFLPIDADVNDDVNYYISPYYRFYFGSKFASGFFLEGFGMLNSVNDRAYYYNDGLDPTIEEKNVTDFALGIGLGGKWVTKRGLIGELNLGIGRNLFSSSEYDDNEFVGKLGITVGYRF
ncbi:uncharacterized protein DUF3575 [Flavobacteriaceae bacterium MAR_2010_72]|nr:uncharacterized protein DUF3575 [Flavobacteriaceae bacterium MAR_2010_72]